MGFGSIGRSSPILQRRVVGLRRDLVGRAVSGLDLRSLSCGARRGLYVVPVAVVGGVRRVAP
eukprot:7199960-Lingulodinium_polyedra.AAC.1